MAVLLITPQEIINKAIPDPNFDPALLKDSFIEAAQWDYIRPVLGETLYEAVIAAPSSYTVMCGYIKDCLAFYALAKAMPFIQYNLSAQGVQVNFTQYTRAATNEDKANLVNGIISIGDDFREKLEEYLSDNDATYTTYANEITDNNNYGGIVL